MVDLGHGGEDAGDAVGAERDAVRLPHAPEALPLPSSSSSSDGSGGEAVEQAEDPVAVRGAQLLELLLQDHLVDLGPARIREMRMMNFEDIRHVRRASLTRSPKGGLETRVIFMRSLARSFAVLPPICTICARVL